MTESSTPSVSGSLAEAEAAGAVVRLDSQKLSAWMTTVQREQSLLRGVLAGLVAALVAGFIWAGITLITDFQIGWMAVGVGFLVGLAMRSFGKGLTPVFGLSGAGLSLLGCLTGNLLTVAMVLANRETVPLWAVVLVLITNPAMAWQALSATFAPIDLLFYGLALYQGYKLSFRRFNEAEIGALTQWSAKDAA